MTSRELIRWSALHERRARRGWWTSGWVFAIAAGGAIAAFVAWRGDRMGAVAAAHAWLAAAIVAHAIAFLRVPFHLYWRSDAALLAQLPIEGRALFDAALSRCLKAAAATLLACAIGAAPLVHAHVVRSLAVAGALALTAGLLVPAVVVWAASLLVRGDGGKSAATAVRTAMSIVTAAPGYGAQMSSVAARSSAGAVLGAIPGAAGVLIISSTISCSGWLTGKQDDAYVVLVVLAVASVVALIVARRAAARVMATILRDVSALDRQRLAPLEIHPPTAIERGVAALLGAAGLPYRKDARLMRRRYPMAFALGALAFLVLAIVGLARPGDAAPWLVATVGPAAIYAAALAGRLRRPPIELARLSATLPIAPSARARAKVAWLAVWSLVFVIVPLGFALARLASTR